MSSAAGTLGVDFSDPGLPARLPVAFDALREADPVWEVRPGVWFLTRHDDVAAVLKDRVRCGTDLHAVRGYDRDRPFGAGSSLERLQEGLLVNLGAADHRRVRGAFTAPFTRSAVERSMGVLVERVTAELLDSLAHDGEVDIVTAVARPLPARVFAALFDLPAGDVAWLLERLHEDTVAFDVLLDPALVAPGDLARGQSAMADLWGYLAELAQLRRTRPGEDLMSWLVAAQARGVLSADDVVTQAFEALAAGTSTTSTLVAGMVEALAAAPAEWERVRADEALVRPGVEEALRVVSPALSMNRVALEDFELRGRSIRTGDVLQAAVLAANRDPAVFAAPHAFDAGRAPNPHVAFGGGAHTCLGAHVARLEARTVLAGLRRRWRRLEVAPDAAVWHPTLLIRTYASLRVGLAA